MRACGVPGPWVGDCSSRWVAGTGWNAEPWASPWESIRVRGDSERGGGSGVLLDAPCEGRSVSLEWWFRETGAESVKALRRPSDQPIIQRTPYLHFQVFPVSPERLLPSHPRKRRASSSARMP